ncbi:MAG: FAD:protein FMN transferase [Anaerococcus sp.]|nr:FAD:protein FMN transferase [Anaerococcus sp.]MDY2918469.1 FAD:protein FMN transferase [Anaerococcus sp.]
MRVKKIVYALALASLITGCANESVDPKEVKDIEEVEDVREGKTSDSRSVKKLDKTFYEYFDTVTIFLTYSDDKEEFDRLSKVLEKELAKYHKLYNSYDDFEGVNNFKTINDKAGVEPVKVEPEIIELIDYSKEMYELTGGKINIALGSVLEIWHNYRDMATKDPDNAAIPSDKELEEAAKHKDIDAIEVDHENSTVFIKDPEVRIDIGAIGKGFATEKIAKVLENEGLASGLLSVGGDDVIIGKNPNNEEGKWKIAIQNPFLDQKDKPYAVVVDVNESNLVTSGDYQRFFTVDGKNYHHIIDPETNYPSDKWKSVSVTCDSIALADTLSTYLFLIDQEEGQKILDENNALGYWIDTEGNEYKSEGWDEIEDKDFDLD